MTGRVKDATILVVEDNVSNFVLMARMLGFMGLQCEWKTSGFEVAEYANTLPHIDLILMDIDQTACHHTSASTGAPEKGHNPPNLKKLLGI